MRRYEAQNIEAPDGLAANEPFTGDLGQIELGKIELGQASTETRGSCGIMLDVIFNLIPGGIHAD